jgi:hypothetical protein
MSAGDGREHAMNNATIDEEELGRVLSRAGLVLTPEQVRAILPGAEIFRRMLERVNAPLPREAEPALTFTVEQDQ